MKSIKEYGADMINAVRKVMKENDLTYVGYRDSDASEEDIDYMLTHCPDDSIPDKRLRTIRVFYYYDSGGKRPIKPPMPDIDAKSKWDD